jgi:hypothetical protein
MGKGLGMNGVVILAAMAALTGIFTTAHAKAKYEGRLEMGEWRQVWSTTLNDSLARSGLFNHKEKQIEVMCPGYSANRRGKRQLFWLQLMISLSWKESWHGPRNYVYFNKGTNNGLFQINPRLREAYDCGSVDLFNPIENIRCAVRMATKLVSEAGSFLVGSKGGMAAYWQPLRGTSKLNRSNRDYILTAVKNACASGRLDYHSTERPTSIGVAALALAEADVTYNTTDDLGLSESDLEPIESLYQYPYDPATFSFDPESGVFFDLRN